MSVSHKVKMLESVVVNLTNKISEETRVLKEGSKAIRSEIKSLKPSFSDLFRNREDGIHPSGRAAEINHPSGPNGPNDEVSSERRPKRSRTGDGIFHTSPRPMETVDEVIQDDF